MNAFLSFYLLLFTNKLGDYSQVFIESIIISHIDVPIRLPPSPFEKLSIYDLLVVRPQSTLITKSIPWSCVRAHDVVATLLSYTRIIVRLCACSEVLTQNLLFYAIDGVINVAAE